MRFRFWGRMLLALVLISTGHIAAAALHQAGEAGYMRRSALPVVVRSGSRVLWVRAERHTVYKFRDEDVRDYVLSIKYGEQGKQVFSTAGFFRVAGKPERVQIRFLDPADGEFIQAPVGSDVADELVFKRGGKVSLEAALGDLRARIQVNVIELPFSRNASAETVIGAIGVPDETERQVVMWPEDKRIDRIPYYQSDTSESVSGTHWYYEKYPHLALCIRNEKVVEIGFRDPPFGWEYHIEKNPDYLEEREWLDAPASVPPDSRPEGTFAPTW